MMTTTGSGRRIALVLALAVGLHGCSTNMGTGAIVGAGAGAAIGGHRVR